MQANTSRLFISNNVLHSLYTLIIDLEQTWMIGLKHLKLAIFLAPARYAEIIVGESFLTVAMTSTGVANVLTGAILFRLPKNGADPQK